MSGRVAIRLENVTKRYRAGRSRTVVDLIASSINRARGRSQDVYSLSRGRIDSYASVWYQSAHHSHVLPTISHSPNAFGG